MIEQAIAVFFQTYAAAFTARDVDAISSLWDYPAFLTACDRAATYADEKSFGENTAKLCEFYQTQGVTEATKELINVDELYPTIVRARTKDRLFSEDGELVAEWEHVYLLRQSSAGWKAVWQALWLTYLVTLAYTGDHAKFFVELAGLVLTNGLLVGLVQE